MGIFDKLKDGLGGVAEQYVKQQLRDLKRFVLLAIAADPSLMSEDGLKRAFAQGIRYVSKHGTPNAAHVAEAMKKGGK